MKREASDRLDLWFHQTNRKPLVLRGARQTGKTWIVRDLAQRQHRTLIEINFDRTPEMASYFKEKNPIKILQNLSAEFGFLISPETSLLFLDEIQEAPEIFSTLRWFKEELSVLPVIATGSLLDFVLNDHEFSMPVGRIHYFYLEPMSFLEFVLSTGNEPLYETLKTTSFDEPLHETHHQKCMTLYRDYCLCGGMPEAVQKWKDTSSLAHCMTVQTDLLATIRDDFNKYGKNSLLLRKTLRSVANQIGNKFILSRVGEEYRALETKNALAMLSMARVVSLVHHTAGNGIPLGAEMNDKFFKALFLDTGLVSSHLGLARMASDDIWKAIFSNRGAIAEQFVGQQLRYALAQDGDPELFYWQRTGGRQGELDYLIQSGSHIIPIEVKSGASGTMKSLHQFMFDKNLKSALRFDANNLSHLEIEIKTTQGDPAQYTMLSAPVYLAERAFELLHSYFRKRI